MSIDLIVKIAGVLGFLISVATFVLTRIERRKNIQIEIFEATAYDFRDLVKDSESFDDSGGLFKVRFTNIGAQPVILKPDTFQISHMDKIFEVCREDYLGKENFQELMPPTSMREIGVFEDLVRSKLGIVSPESYDDGSFNKLYKLELSVADHAGKVYRNSKHSFHESVGEFVT